MKDNQKKYFDSPGLEKGELKFDNFIAMHNVRPQSRYRYDKIL